MYYNCEYILTNNVTSYPVHERVREHSFEVEGGGGGGGGGAGVELGFWKGGGTRTWRGGKEACS